MCTSGAQCQNSSGLYTWLIKPETNRSIGASANGTSGTDGKLSGNDMLTFSLQQWPLCVVVAFFDLGFHVTCRWEQMNSGMKNNTEEAIHHG